MKPSTRSHYETVVRQTIHQIAGHLDAAVDLADLASAAAIAPFHFHRIFRGMVGETPLELARRLRLERAAWRLASTDESVTHIAFGAGYDAHEAFTRTFRARYDTSPTVFRTRKFPRIELAARSGVHYRPDGAAPDFVPRPSEGHPMHVEIKTMPALRLATVRHMGPYNQIPLAFARLGQLLGPHATALRTSGSPMIAIYHDDPEAVPLEELRSDAAVSVPADMALPTGLVEATLREGRYACTLHVGPYEHLGDAWARFMGEWLPASGRRVASTPAYEVYLNDPRTTPKVNLRTELYLPLEDSAP